MKLPRLVDAYSAILLVWLLTASQALWAQAAGTPQATLETLRFQINDVSLLAEIADDVSERRQGLSFRKGLKANEGMLFVYERERKLLFTMQDASIPLSIAFLDADMIILEILPMTPFTPGPYASSKPAKFALEMNQGWFESHNIKPGNRLQLN